MFTVQWYLCYCLCGLVLQMKSEITGGSNLAQSCHITFNMGTVGGCKKLTPILRNFVKSRCVLRLGGISI